LTKWTTRSPSSKKWSKPSWRRKDILKAASPRTISYCAKPKFWRI